MTILLMIMMMIRAMFMTVTAEISDCRDCVWLMTIAQLLQLSNLSVLYLQQKAQLRETTSSLLRNLDTRSRIYICRTEPSQLWVTYRGIAHARF